MVLQRNAGKGEQYKAIDMAIMEYMFPGNDEGKLDKKLFEERFDLLNRAMMERALLPMGKFAIDNDQHSKKWIWQQVNAVQPMGVLPASLQIYLLGLPMALERFIKEAYQADYHPKRSGSMILLDKYREKRISLCTTYAENLPEMKKAAMEAKYYFGNEDSVYDKMSKAEKQRQKQMEQNESFLDGDDEMSIAVANANYEAFLDLDLDYINRRSRKAIQENMVKQRQGEFDDENWDPQKTLMGKVKSEILTKTDNIAERLNTFTISGFRLTNSRKFNNLLDDMEKLRAGLKYYDSTKNWSEIKKTLEKFKLDCNEYLKKTEGPRKTPGGRRRQSIAKELNKLADDAFGQMKEADKKELKKTDYAEKIQRNKIKMSIAELADVDNRLIRTYTIPKNPENSMTRRSKTF